MDNLFKSQKPDSTFNKIEQKINQDVLEKMKDNAKYAFLDFSHNPENKYLDIFNNQNEEDILFFLYSNIWNFKNLNFFKTNDISAKKQADLDNTELFKTIWAWYNKLIGQFNVSDFEIKQYMWLQSRSKKIIDVVSALSENFNEVLNFVKDDETLTKNLEEIAKFNNNYDWARTDSETNNTSYIKNILDNSEILIKDLIFKSSILLKNDDNSVKVSNTLSNKLFSWEIDIMKMYRLLSFCNTWPLSINKDDIENLKQDNQQWKYFYYSNNIVTNKWYFVVTEVLWSNFNSAKVFDWALIWFTNKKPEDIDTELKNSVGAYRNNSIYLSDEEFTAVKSQNLTIDPALDLFFNFKWLKIKPTFNNEKTFLLNMDTYSLKYFNDEFLPNIKDITKYKWNSNFINLNFIHNDVTYTEKFEQSFSKWNWYWLSKEYEASIPELFLKYCNFWLDKDNLAWKHSITTLSWTYSELIQKIKSYDKIVIADFESTWLNKLSNSDIVSMSYKMFDKSWNEDRSRTYFFDTYKENISKGAEGSFDVNDYNNNKDNHYNRDFLIKGIKSLANEKTLFVFHNAYWFDLKILLSNFDDKNEKLENFHCLDSIVLAREYYKSKRDPDWNTYSYSLDNLTRFLKVENNRDAENHRSEEDVEILSKLFYTLIKK